MPTYACYFDALWNSQAVEGNIANDEAMAALRIRQEAQRIKSPIAKENLATIRNALNVVLRRYGMSRSQRRCADYRDRVSGPKDSEDNGDE